MTAAAPGSGSFALLGPLSLDVYVGRDLVLPGGGALNMAWWWARAGDVPFELLSRVGDDRPEVFRAFLARHRIAATPELVAPGASAAIDIEIRPDLQPHMDHFVEGVWTGYALSDAELARVRAHGRLHLVLVEGAIRELERRASAGALEGVEVSADFLGFRHYTLDRLAATLRHVDVGFVGWPGAPGDDAVAGLRETAEAAGRLLVVTFGSQGVWAFDGRPGARGHAFAPVQPVHVRGTTVGCGDAFIAGFLREWRRSGDVGASIKAGMGPGAAATAWRRPLPDDAYGEDAKPALQRVDRGLPAIASVRQEPAR